MIEWISVKERLPEKDAYFLTFHQDGSIRSNVSWDIHNKRFEEEHEMGWIIPVKNTVTHWTEMPEPPTS